ncbi:MAG: deoxyhypusine synthase family protein [Acidobacteria bacterium]|nr:deoxyhypusine synthase family protein [Acidobacteriota bacterium]
MPFDYELFDLSGVRTYPLKSRPSKARAEDFARPAGAHASIGEFLDALPNVLAAADLRAVARAVVQATRAGSGVVWGIGAHVIKTGLAPVLIDLMERGFVSAIATNGAAVIHDFEVALAGATSEDVDQSLGPGTFGMADETGRLLNGAINAGVEAGLGIGQAVSTYLHEKQPQHARSSLLAAAGRLRIPVTVHVAVGTDIIHMHPAASGAALGEGSLRDFRYFVSNVARLEQGVFINCGSAVVLPEVFLKAVALARNRGLSLNGLTTVNMDFIRSYRPQTNVVSRPTAGTNGKGYSLVGHHELMIPLLAAAILHADR